MGISVGGLSGLDTDSIISQLIELEKVPITKLEARRDKYAEQKTAFENFNTKLLALKSSSETLLTATSWSAKSTNISDTSILSATSSSTAAEGTYKFTNIVLGTQAFTKSTADIAANTIKNSTKTLKALSDDGDFVDPLLSNGNGKFKIVLRNKADGSEVKSSQIEFNTTDTLNTFITKINRASVGVTAFYDEDSSVNGKFVLTANEAGDYFIDITTDVDGGGSDDLGIIDTLNLTADIGAVAAPANNANFVSGTSTAAELNGVTINPTGNSYTVNGTTVNFLSDGDSTVVVKKNTSAISNLIKDFVKKYNDVQDFIKEQTKLSTVSTLSSESDSDTSSRGPLAGNFLVTDISFNMNTQTMQAYSELRNAGQYSMLSEIGISLGKYGTTDANHLVIDENKLQAAIDANSDQVQLLFGYKTSTPTETKVVADNGIAYKINAYLNPITRYSGMITNEKNALQSIIDSINDNIDRQTERLERVEETYRKQFSRMEQQLSTLNSQGEYFSSQLSSLSSN
ncbi:flagellar filament capping protein FliD [Candidatus Dependentiae bacterium]|nr:flagellar filament capping protein FliD [Candidatus Dependentiae bacterium]